MDRYHEKIQTSNYQLHLDAETQKEPETHWNSQSTKPQTVNKDGQSSLNLHCLFCPAGGDSSVISNEWQVWLITTWCFSGLFYSVWTQTGTFTTPSKLHSGHQGNIQKHTPQSKKHKEAHTQSSQPLKLSDNAAEIQHSVWKAFIMWERTVWFWESEGL